MTQRALKKKSGSVRSFLQPTCYTIVGVEDRNAWDTCTYTFGNNNNSLDNNNIKFSADPYHHVVIDNSYHHRRRPPPPPPPVAKSTVTTQKSRSTDPQHSSSSSTKPHGSSSSSGGILSLFKLKKNKPNSTPILQQQPPVDTTPSTCGTNSINDPRVCRPAESKPPVLHLKRTRVRNHATGETEDHFAIVPADKILAGGGGEEQQQRHTPQNVLTPTAVCSRGWESPVIINKKPGESPSQLNNPVYDQKLNEKQDINDTNEVFERDLFGKQITQSAEQFLHVQKRANRYALSSEEEAQEKEGLDEENDSGKGPSLGNNSTSLSDESSALNSLDISGYIEWEDDEAASAINKVNSMDIKRRSLASPYDMSLAYPMNGVHFSTMPHKMSSPDFYSTTNLVDRNGIPLLYSKPNNAIYETPSNGIRSLGRSRKVLKPSSEFILMGPYEPASSSVVNNRMLDISMYSSSSSSGMSLAKSKGKFSSMPSLNVLNKKMAKDLKKEKEKEEKLEKKRKKQEKKERKKAEKESRKSGQTLPRNWEYVKKPIEFVYEKPRTEWKLTPVPISLDEPIYEVPKKTGMYSKMVHYASTPDLQRVEEVYGSTGITVNNDNTKKDNHDTSDYAPRAVVLRKGPNGFGFVLRGAKGDSPGFRPPPTDAPAMQYLDTVDKGSVADKAGLKGGDFILEINGQNVTRASHEYVVSLIKSSGHSLTMNVLTVKPTERDQNWYVHQDGSMTLPHRRKQAPEPPRRDPKTSLSFSKAKSKSFAEGMAEIEKLDQALAEYDVSDAGESSYGSAGKHNGAEMKTASIRAGYAKKRVSSVEMENLCRLDSPHKPEHLSPSEVRIKKYHKKQSNLEKSQSTPNLAQNLEELHLEQFPGTNSNQPMYRTVASSGPSDYSPHNSSSCSSGPRQYTQRLHPVPYMGNLPNSPPGMDVSGCRYSVAIGHNVQVNSLPSHTRGKARPVAPPVVQSKNPAPAAPPQVVKINTNKEQPVYASVVNGSVRTGMQTQQKENPYESSFRPGTVAMFSNKTPVVTPSALSQVKLHPSKQNESPSDSSLQNALLVKADVHTMITSDGKDDKKQSYYEPEPDYDLEDDKPNKDIKMVNDSSSHKTVISVNNNNGAPPTSNGYGIRQLPANVVTNPVYSIPQQNHFYAVPSMLPPPDQISLGVGTPVNIMPAKSPTPSSSTTETVAPPPPPPPPAPPLQLIPPPPQFCPPPPPAAFAKSPASENSNEFLSEIQRVAKERMTRSKDADVQDKSQLEQSSKNLTPMDKNQAAILEAVAKRRTMLEQNEENILNQIETQIQKSKNFQSAKYYNSGNGVKKEIEVLSENKESSEEKLSAIPPVPASKPIKQVVSAAKPVAPAKPKVAAEKVHAKPPAPQSVSATIAVDKGTKAMAPLKENATAEKMTHVNVQKSQEPKTIMATTKISEKAKVVETVIRNNKDSGGEEDFLKKAEKARQMYLQLKSGSGSEKSTPQSTPSPTPTPPAITVKTSVNNTVPPPNNTIHSTNITMGVNGEAKIVTQKSLSNKSVQNTNKTNVELTKKKAPVMKTQLSNSSTKSNRMHIEVQSTSNPAVMDKIGNVSIKDRIASLQKQNYPLNSSSSNQTKQMTLKGVTTSHSHTDPFNSSDSGSTPNDSPYHETNIVAPPPGFGDNDPSISSVESFSSPAQLQTLPAPLSELSISTVPPYNRPTMDNLVPQDDSLSLISSLSTLSTLSTSSTEHPIEIVPPPPSGFEDKASPVSTDQGFEESFIPPPPQFDAFTKNAASTKNSFRNKPVEDWFYVDVLDWLESVQMQQYKVNFANHCIDGKKLLNLKRAEYITLGVTQVGHRMNLERSIKKLVMASQQKSLH